MASSADVYPRLDETSAFGGSDLTRCRFNSCRLHRVGSHRPDFSAEPTPRTVVRSLLQLRNQLRFRKSLRWNRLCESRQTSKEDRLLSPETPVSLVGVGYEGRSVNDVIEFLSDREVDLVIDVRQNAISRKAGLSKKALAAHLLDSGIEYIHEPTLGNPKENRDGYRQGKPAALDAYTAVLEATGAEAIMRLRELTATRVVALLCFESDESTCHRSAISSFVNDG